MSLMTQVQRGRMAKPPRILVYGTEGIGKSTFGSQAPKPIFVQTEDGLDELDCDKFPLATNYDDVLTALTELKTQAHDYESIVIDSLDWLERLIWDKLCAQNGVNSIEKVDGGYARGYTHALTYWREIIDQLNVLRNGYTGRNFRDSRAVLRFAFGRGIEAGFSTIDIGGILSNVANKFLLEGFFSVERTWRNICAVRNVSDFKTVTSYRLIGKDQYELVAPGGNLKQGTLGNEQFTNKADTYGLVLGIDRRDMINDDLGAITTVPRKLGRGSGLKINDVFWTIFLNNAAFFTAGNKNYLTGAATALGIDGLTAAEVAFMDQVDGDGKPIGIMPAIALVPTALSAIGSQLYKSLELRDTTANAKFPIANPHQGKFRVEVSRYLANAVYTGNSAKAWYLLSEPSDLPVIEVAFLNGQEAPTIETAEADFNVLGVQMRGYHDFGVALQDFRGGVKSKGEA